MEDVKDWLRRGRRLDAEIKQLEKAKTEAFAQACGGAVDTSLERVQGGGGNATEEKFLRYVELDSLISERIGELMAVKAEIIRCINTLENSTYRAVLIAYYINCETWEKIAESMECSERWVYTLHKKALKKVTARDMTNLSLRKSIDFFNCFDRHSN